jgi:hypothetical protein
MARQFNAWRNVSPTQTNRLMARILASTCVESVRHLPRALSQPHFATIESAHLHSCTHMSQRMGHPLFYTYIHKRDSLR